MLMYSLLLLVSEGLILFNWNVYSIVWPRIFTRCHQLLWGPLWRSGLVKKRLLESSPYIHITLRHNLFLNDLTIFFIYFLT